MNCESCGREVRSGSSSNGAYHCEHCGHRGFFGRGPSMGSQGGDGPGDAAATSRKRGRERESTVAVSLGRPANTLRLERRDFRFAFQNVENLTDLFYQGNRMVRDSVLSPRNTVRLEFLAEVLVALDLDGFAIMEMGSDAEAYLRRLSALLNELDGDHSWEFIISEDTGRTVAPPDELQVQFVPYADVERNIGALATLLPYYDFDPAEVEPAEAPRADRILLALRMLVRLCHPTGRELLLATVDALEDFEGTPFERLAMVVREVRRVALRIPDGRGLPYYRLLLLFTGDAATRAGILQVLLDDGALDAIAIYCVLSGTAFGLRRHDRARIETDGPRAALRQLGYNVGRYEKYGLVWRTGLHESYLLNDLVRTRLLEEGRRTNSRAAMRFRLPLGRGDFFTADLLHNMWSAAPGAEQDRGVSERELRIRSLCGHAEEARRAEDRERPLFIFTDSNVGDADLDTLNHRMRQTGYSRLGDARATTLRQEHTLRRASDDFWSQPYDAVYQDADRAERLPTRIEYPDHTTTVLRDVLLRLLSRNFAVRQWYFGMLYEEYAQIYRLAARQGGPNGSPSCQRLTEAMHREGEQLEEGFDRRLDAYRGDDGAVELFLSSLFKLLRAHLSDGRNTAEDSTPAERLVALLRSFLSLAPGAEKLFVLFHRHFISDHRMLVVLLEYNSLVIDSRMTPSRRRLHRRPVGAAIEEEGFERGSASGTGLSCFLASLLQLLNDTEEEDDEAADALREAMALDGVIPRRGPLDAGDGALAAWFEDTYPNYTLNIRVHDADSGLLVIRHTLGRGDQELDMLLSGDHFEPLWQAGRRPHGGGAFEEEEEEDAAAGPDADDGRHDDERRARDDGSSSEEEEEEEDDGVDWLDVIKSRGLLTDEEYALLEEDVLVVHFAEDRIDAVLDKLAAGLSRREYKRFMRQYYY